MSISISSKLPYKLYGRYSPDIRQIHPTTILDHVYSYCASTHKKWEETSGKTKIQVIQMRENIVKQEALKIFAPEVANYYRGLPLEEQSLPIRRHEYYDGENFLDNYLDYFNIPDETEHARDTLSLMRMDTSTTDNCFERLQQVKHFAEKDPSTGYNMAVDAFLNAYNSVNTETTQALRVERFHHTTFASYFTKAKPIALRGSLKSLPVLTTTTHYDSNGEDTKISSAPKRSLNELNGLDQTEQPDKKSKYTREERLAYWKRKREEKAARRSVMNAMKTKSTSQVPAGQAPTSSSEPPEWAQSFLNAMSQLVAKSNSSAQELQSSHSTPLSQPYSSTRDSSNDRTYGVGNQNRSRAPVPGHYGRVASTPTVNPNLYCYNPPGHEPWKKWFRVCGNCRKWGAHFARECVEPEHIENSSNPPDYRNPVPLVAYPADLAQANALAQAEKSIYGAHVRWNCRPEQRPLL
jgi:hypothetical protein